MQVTVYVVTFHGVPRAAEDFDTTVGIAHTFSEAIDNMKSYFEEDETIVEQDNTREHVAYYITNYGEYRIERHMMWMSEKIF